MNNNSIMKYKDYSALIRYSEEDGCLIGRVLGISDVVLFEGESVEQIRAEFKKSLDDYLALCKEEGKEPERPYSGKIIVRMPPELHRRVAIAAEAQGISMNDAIIRAMESMYSEPDADPGQPTGGKKPRRAKVTA
ncbi:MAG: type II toxin-antitoxin system HicB family antitoxin [Planctomycetaceae bacterium]|nr:type II toxin-antitoxin system HicB family antitoxin [Planctomycetaceae bacterium]